MLPAIITMDELPEPPAIEPGLKDTVTPAGCPEAVRVIEELKPFEGVAVILPVALAPGAIVNLAGDALSVKLAGAVTVSVTVVVSFVLPEVPVTVMG